ncbi:MAG TPA: hypothetical protein VMO80_05450 [Terriglobales bacterium]|jgi:hypothetical protein|nr:hypothetical protein [Terriglobales bacterium]
MFLVSKAAWAGVVFIFLATGISGPRPTPLASGANLSKEEPGVGRRDRDDIEKMQELLRHASFRTTMDGYTQALEQPKRQAQEQLADLIMHTSKVGHA